LGLTRGRILPAEGAALLPTVLAPPTRRAALRPRAWVEAQEAAQQIEAAARAAAQALLAQAQGEATRLRQEALREGQEAAELELTARWLALKQAEERWLQGREGDILAVARLLAERLLLRELEVRPATIVDLTRQALAPLRRAGRVAFHVHPEDAGPLQSGLLALGLNTDRIEVNSDPAAPRGSVRITTELGAIRAELAPQLDRLLAALRAP